MNNNNLGIYSVVNIISNRSKIISRSNRSFANTSHIQGPEKNNPVTLAYEEYKQGCCPMLLKTDTGLVSAKNIKYKF